VASEIAVIGTSWGGLAALHLILAALPKSFALPIVVVQHRHKDSGQFLPRVLQEDTRLCVCEVEDKAPIVGGNVYIAPANYHVLVERGHLALSTEEPVSFSRPSIDVTFMSAADAYRAGAVGIVLTGANADGARGLKRIVDRGGIAIVQRPETAESPVMPTAALSFVPTARVLTLAGIGSFLGSLTVKAAQPQRTVT
jgi:two-component system, chemotaxis family, protein-glutamate methylesterase/glutaminase